MKNNYSQGKNGYKKEYGAKREYGAKPYSKGNEDKGAYGSRSYTRASKKSAASFDKKKSNTFERAGRNENAEAPKREASFGTEAAELHENMLEGRNPIREALKAGRSIERLLVAQGEIQGSVKEIVYEANKNGAIVQEVERVRLDKLSVTGAHQGIIAFAAMKEYCSVEDILAYAVEKGEKPFIIILDGICDPQNLGAIIRSAECAGAHGVIIPERRAVGLTPVVAKCSAGAIEYMRIARVTNISQTIERLKKANIWVYGASMEGKSYSKMNFDGATALVIGAEGEGLSPLVKKNCDCLVSLPQLGHIDSLNASVAAGILMYEVLRQKNS